MIRPMKYVVLRNYIDLLTSEEFWHSLYVTFIYILETVPTSVILGLLLALLLSMNWLKGKGLFRTVFYIPVITAMAAAAVVWNWLFEPNVGLINYILGFFGIAPKKWLNDPHWAIVALIIVGVWKRIGYNMVLFLAGHQTIPKTYYEAAMVDGATTFARFWHITLPLLSPTTLFVTIIQFIASFRVFISVSVMTRGGAARSTEVITYFLYENAFNYLKMGMLNSFKALIVPFMSSAFGVFLLRQFFLTIPKELEDAARIDGCGRLRILWNVILPLSKPALWTMALYTFLAHWNSYMWPLVAINNDQKQMIQVGISKFASMQKTEKTLQMTSSTVAIVPIIIFFFFVQKHFMEGISISGMKE